MVEPQKLRKPTPRMLEVLGWIAKGYGAGYDCNCQSDYGGREGTLFALRKRGLLDRDNKITEAGRTLLGVPTTS